MVLPDYCILATVIRSHTLPSSPVPILKPTSLATSGRHMPCIETGSLGGCHLALCVALCFSLPTGDWFGWLLWLLWLLWLFWLLGAGLVVECAHCARYCCRLAPSPPMLPSHVPLVFVAF